MTVPMFSEDPDELCAFPGEFPEEYREAIESGIWNNETTIRSLENFIEFEPAGWIPYITPKPLLMIIAEHDRCTFTEVQREVYETTPEPKKLLSYDGGVHFGLLADRDLQPSGGEAAAALGDALAELTAV